MRQGETRTDANGYRIRDYDETNDDAGDRNNGGEVGVAMLARCWKAMG